MGLITPKLEKTEVKLPGQDNIEGYDVNEDFIRGALQQANTNTLRLALIQATEDKELEVMHVTNVEFRRAAAITYTLSDADNEKVRETALKCLLCGKRGVPPPLPKREAFRMMDLYGNIPLGTEGYLRGDYEELLEELAFEDFQRDIKWTNGPPADLHH